MQGTMKRRCTSRWKKRITVENVRKKKKKKKKEEETTWLIHDYRLWIQELVSPLISVRSGNPTSKVK